MNKILQELKDRGMISNISDEKKFIECIKEKKSVYIGFDPSFFSLHLGNFLMIRVLQIFQKYKVKVVPLIGGATGQIGDPSGKTNERKLLEKKVINENIKKITDQLKKLTNCELVLNNYEFYKKMSLFDFFKKIGKEFNVSYLIAKETIKNRLETGISYTEFSYTIIQAYDWYFLNKHYNIGIQCGGSDQWGNITSGLEYIRKKEGFETIIAGLTINLLIKNDGTKFGKSEKGAIFLDKKLTSVYEMYQFLFNQNDNDVEKLLMFLTSYEVSEIKEIVKIHFDKPSKRFAQKKLCENVIEQIHGKEEFKQIVKLNDLLFNQKYSKLSLKDFETIFKNEVKLKIFSLPIKLIDIIVENKIISSKRIARDLFKSKSIFINGNLVDEHFIINEKDLIHKKYLIFKKGKKSFFIFEK